jgi:RecB family exonuclease
MDVGRDLHLYPSALARDAALDAIGPAAWTDNHRTFAEFAAELHRLLPGAEEPQAPIAGAARFALLLDAAGRAVPRRDAERFTSDAALQAAGKLIAAWKGAGLTPDHVAAAAKSLARSCTNKDTLALLARVYAAYEEQLAPGGIGGAWTDREGHEHRLVARLERADALPARLLAPGAALHVHAFHRLVPFHQRLLKRIAALGHPVHMDTPLGTVEPPREHFRVEAATPYAEVYEIGRRVRAWIVEEHIAPAAICLALRDPGMYSQVVADVFRRFGIPFYERRGEPAVFQPVVRAALSALDACVNGLARADVFRFLCSGLPDLAVLVKRPGEEVDAGELHDLALAAHIDRFFGSDAEKPANAWQTRLQHHAERADECGKRGAAVLSALVARMDGLRGTRTLAAHAKAWRQFFRDAGMDAAGFPGRREGATPNWEDLRRDRLALQAVESALESFASGPLAGGAAVPLQDFARLLNLELAEHSVREDSGGPGGVRVLSLYDLRGLRFRKLVLAGMTEGVFPAPQPADPLLGRGAELATRKALAAQLRDASAAQHLEPCLADEWHREEAALLDIARAAASGGTLVFTRARQGFDREPLVPSTFWNAVDRSAPTEQAASIQPAPALTQCLTAEEAELRAAWVLGGGDPSPSLLPHGEAPLAAACFRRSVRLEQLARLAAIEDRRRRFFASQSLAQSVRAEQQEQDETTPLLKRAAAETASVTEVAAGAYDGVVAARAPEAAGSLAQVLPAQSAQEPNALSPSALETLAACPFAFLVRQVWRLREQGEPEEELSPLDKGELWHTVLARFYREQVGAARAAGRLVARLDAGERGPYLARLRAIADKLIEETPQRAFIGHPGLWRLQREQLSTALESWLDHELALCAEAQFCCAETELRFGSSPKDTAPPVNVPVPRADGGEETLTLAGRMDRLDLLVDNPDAPAPRVSGLRVIDYKLGRCSSYKNDVKPEALADLLAAQLPVYLLAALGYLRTLEKEKRVRVAWDETWANLHAGYYCLRDVPSKVAAGGASLVLIAEWPGEKASAREFLATEGTLSDLSLFRIVRARVAEVLRGRYPVFPHACGATHCPGRFVCRYQAVPEEDDATEGGRKGGAP